MAIAQSALPTINLLMIVTRRTILVELVTEMNLIQMQIRDCEEREARASFLILINFNFFNLNKTQ